MSEYKKATELTEGTVNFVAENNIEEIETKMDGVYFEGKKVNNALGAKLVYCPETDSYVVLTAFKLGIFIKNEISPFNLDVKDSMIHIPNANG